MKVCPVCQREYPDGAVNCTDDAVPLVAMVTDVHGRSEELIGKIVEGRYKIERIIGKGGMGTVYACRHIVVGKVAAMKVLKAGVERSDGVLQRFVREAQTANLLKSRHIVEVSDFGQLPNGAFFVVMELLEGQDLARAMRNGLGRREMVHVFTQVAETLQIAHEKGIVHRDLKPDNVFLVHDGGDPLFVKLLDFGIAKILHGEGNSGLTETGVILGTPYYMSPEQARAETIDHRSDIYALGVMMYRAFTGRLPFMADSTMGVLTRHITEAPQPPSEIVQVDQTTERMILRCLAKKPEYRFQSMREVAEALKLVPLDPGSANRDHTTVYEGPIPGVTAPSGAHAAAAYTPQPSGPHAAARSGAYTPQPSGPYPQVPVTSGPYPAAPGQDGAYPQASHAGGYGPQAPSRDGGYGPQAPSRDGGYGPQTPSGAHPQMASGAFAATYAAGMPSGGFAPAVVGVVPGAASTGTMTALNTSGPQSAPVIVGEPTTRGLAANNYPPPARTSNALLILVGGVSMAAIGAVAAFFLVARQPPVSQAQGAQTVIVIAAPPPIAAAPPTASASASATAEPSASASATPKVPVHLAPRPPPPPPPVTATVVAPAPNPKIPRDIRSPFD